MRSRRASSTHVDAIAPQRADAVGCVNGGKPAPGGCEELLYPVKEPGRLCSSTVGEPSINQSDGSGTRRRRSASAVSRCLQW
jgi:hypothetical protein